MGEENMLPAVIAPFSGIGWDDLFHYLEALRVSMGLDLAALLPGQEEDFSTIADGDTDAVLRFFLPADALPLWEDDADRKIGETAYDALDTFLDDIYLDDTDDLAIRWSKTSREQLRRRFRAMYRTEPPEEMLHSRYNYSIPDAIEFAQKDPGVADFLRACGIGSGLSGHSDEDIYIILGILMFWISRLPCAEKAQVIQLGFQANLLSKLPRILQQDRDLFRSASKEATKDALNQRKLSNRLNEMELGYSNIVENYWARDGYQAQNYGNDNSQYNSRSR